MYLVYSYAAAPCEVFALFQVETNQRPDSPVTEIDYTDYTEYTSQQLSDELQPVPGGKQKHLTFASLCRFFSRAIPIECPNGSKWMLQLESPHLKLQARPNEIFVEPQYGSLYALYVAQLDHNVATP